MKALVILNEAYINPAIVSLTSFFKYNPEIEVIGYAEQGGDYSKLTQFSKLTIVEREFPKDILTGKVQDLRITPEAVPSTLARLQALEEFANNTTILNFDLDTLFLDSINLEFGKEGLYGVPETHRANWVQKDVVHTNTYLNSGFIIYHNVSCIGLYQGLLDFLKTPDGKYLPTTEQDYINIFFKDDVKYRLPNKYNSFFVQLDYTKPNKVMIHYLDCIKPWLMDTYGVYGRKNTTWFKEYFKTVLECKGLDRHFYNICEHNSIMEFNNRERTY